MDDERAEELLDQISSGEREALGALFDEAAPAVAAQLAFGGVPIGAAERAIVQTFADVWQGEYSAPLRPGQSLLDWLGGLARDHAQSQTPGQPQASAPITPALWKRVEQAAFPESWRNILRRTDVIFGIVAAVIWAVILRFIVN